MKPRTPTLIIGGLLLAIFLFLLFAYQVRTTEVAVVTTFGSISGTPKTEPGLYLRLPYPIQNVYKFDRRLQNFERKYEQSLTRDKKSPILSVFVGWRIADAELFLKRFNGDLFRAETSLENVVRDAKNSVVGRHDFSELIAPDPKQVKFEEIENEMKLVMADTTLKTYGIAIEIVGIKQLGLPESQTASDSARSSSPKALPKPCASAPRPNCSATPPSPKPAARRSFCGVRPRPRPLSITKCSTKMNRWPASSSRSTASKPA